MLDTLYLFNLLGYQIDKCNTALVDTSSVLRDF